MARNWRSIARQALDPANLNILGSTDALVGGVDKLDKRAEEEAAAKALADRQAATDEFVNAGPSKYEYGSDYSWQNLSPGERLGPSDMSKIQSDPQYREHEIAALRELEDQSRNGFTARDQADMQRVENQVNRANKGRIGAIQQSMQARGMGGGGLDLMAQLQSSQDANEIAAMKALEQEGMMQDRKSKATLNLGQMSGDMQSRDFNQNAAKAQAEDSIRRFNAANANEVNRYNNAGMNSANAQNIGRRNQTLDRNVGAQGDFNRDRLNAKTGQSSVNYNSANDAYNRKALQDQQNEAAQSQGFERALNTVGSVASIYGSAYGGQAKGNQNKTQPAITKGGQYGAGGYGMGQGRDDEDNRRMFAANGGKVPGYNPDDFPLDSYANDFQPITASPGEIVLPRSVANDPIKSAQFVDEVNSSGDAGTIPARNPIDSRVLDSLASTNPSLVDAYRAKMEKSNTDLEKAQKYQRYGGIADAIGQGIVDYGNSQRKDVILKNRMEDLGKAPSISKAKQSEWRSIMPGFDRGVANAKEERDRNFADVERNAKVDQYGKQADSMNVGSQASQRAQMLAKSVLSAKAKEAEIAGDKAGAAQLRGMDVSNLSASEAKDFYEGLKNSDYKDILNNMAAEQRMKMQIDALRQKTDDKIGEQDDKAVERLGKSISGIQDTANAISKVERQLGGSLDDFTVEKGVLKKGGIAVDLPGVSIPGVGRVSAYDSEARQLESAIGTVFNTELKDRSGAAVTNNEMERLKKEFGSGKYNSEAEMIQALKEYKLAMAKEMKNREASFSPRVNEVYKNRGGQTSDKYNVTESPPAKTQKTLVSKQYSPSRNQTRKVYSDGTFEVIDGN